MLGTPHWRPFSELSNLMIRQQKDQHFQKLRELARIRKQPGMLGCGALSFYFVIVVSVTPITLYYCEKLRNWTEPHF